jgi:hypothetical protein
MGADFLYCTCPKFEPTSKRLTQLRRLVRNIPPTELSELSEERGREVVEIVTEILQAVKQLPELGSRRDVSTINCGDVNCWITGGMSWGDSPTDAYEILEWLTLAPSVLNLLQRWAQEDFAVELQEAG